MHDVRAVYLGAATVALDAIADPAVAGVWDEPSVLDGMTVGALAAHTARALSTVRRYLGGAAPGAIGKVPVDAAGYVVRVVPDTDRAANVNEQVRDRAAEDAAPGHDVVVRRATDDLRALRETLPHLSATHILAVLDGVVMLVDEYLRTRVAELVVHCDDLDASVPGSPRRELPDAAGEVAVGLLAEVARRRSSTTAMIHALARGERTDGAAPRAF